MKFNKYISLQKYLKIMHSFHSMYTYELLQICPCILFSHLLKNMNFILCASSLVWDTLEFPFFIYVVALFSKELRICLFQKFSKSWNDYSKCVHVNQGAFHISFNLATLWRESSDSRTWIPFSWSLYLKALLYL